MMSGTVLVFVVPDGVRLSCVDRCGGPVAILFVALVVTGLRLRRWLVVVALRCLYFTVCLYLTVVALLRKRAVVSLLVY